MISAAHANTFYSKDVAFIQVPSLSDYRSASNVIPIDFVRKSEPRPQSDPLHASEKINWQTIATERLSALHRLSDGWDGDGSRAVSDVALMRAQRVLEFAFDGVESVAPPVAVPCADGSLQLEWWLTDTRFEFCIESDGSFEGWAMDRINGHEFVADGTEAIELLSKWSGRLTADKLARQR